MEPIRWKAQKAIDAHVHYRDKEPIPHFQKILKSVNYDSICILGGHDREKLKYKTILPGKTYIFGMLDQKADKIQAGDGRYLVDQLEALLDIGYDGIKMMDGKPAMRRTWQPLPLDHSYFHPYFKCAEELDVPITLHAVDPIDYWNPDRPDSYANLGTQEEFFRQAIAVMERNPNLRINFAHFLFMGPHLKRLAGLFDRFPKMHVDMAMGQEYLYYMSDDPDASRDFCVKYSSRILYGTDISDHNSLNHGWSKAETLRLFLETDETFDNLIFWGMNRAPEAGSNGRVKLRGLQLPQDALDNIMWRNFERFAGAKPKPAPQS